MGVPDLGQIASVIKDPMLSNLFTLEIPNIPTGTSDEQYVLLQCQQVAKPGWTINNVEAQLFGHTLEYAGNKTFGHDMSATYVDNSAGVILRIFERWGEICRGSKTQLGSYKNDYARDAKLTIFDTTGVAVLIYTIYGVWPNTLPDVSLDGSNSSIISHAIGFKYDWYDKTGGSSS